MPPFLITTTHNQSGHLGHWILPLTPPFITYVETLIGRHKGLAKAVPNLEEFRTSDHADCNARLVNGGPLYPLIQAATEDQPAIVVDIPAAYVAELKELSTVCRQIIVHDDHAQLTGHAHFDDDDYVSAPLEPGKLRQMLHNNGA